LHEQTGGIFNDENNAEMNTPQIQVERIADGLFGHGAISGEAEPEVLETLDNTICHSKDIIVAISREDDGQVLEDDGCGDGRGTTLVYKLGETYKRNLHRAKVFGGSVAMTAAALIGVGKVKYRSFKGIFEDAVALLNRRDMDYGAHTDENASGDNCGCGAIDRAPEAVVASLKYEEPIREVIKKLGVPPDQLDGVYGNFRDYVNELPANNQKDEPYRGKDVMENIEKSGKVIKRLGGDHKERGIILNMVRGYTVNQELIREATNGKAQVFAVDIPRLEDIANNLFPDDPQKQAQAFLSELVYTLSIAAVLTNGDLPVYMIQDAPAPVAA
jgi:hypothetical protein